MTNITVYTVLIIFVIGIVMFTSFHVFKEEIFDVLKYHENNMFKMAIYDTNYTMNIKNKRAKTLVSSLNDKELNSFFDINPNYIKLYSQYVSFKVKNYNKIKAYIASVGGQEANKEHSITLTRIIQYLIYYTKVLEYIQKCLNIYRSVKGV